MSENIRLVKILRLGIYIISLVPLVIFSQFISPFHFGKVVIFRSLIELMVVLYLILVWRDRSYRPRPDLLFWAFLGFTAAFTLATVTSVNPFISFFGTLERMGGAFTFWHYFAFYIVLVSVLRTREDWTTFIKVTVIAGVLSAFYGFGQRTNIGFFIGSGGRERIFGTIGNPALFAGYQIFNIFLAVLLVFWAETKKARNLWLAAAGVMTIAVFMTAVRGSIAGLTLGFLMISYFYFARTHSRLGRKIFTSAITILVVGVTAGLLLRNTSLVKNSAYLSRVTDFSISATTVQTRIWAWQAGLEGWKEGPKTILVGWGPENFNIPFSKHFNPKFFDGPGSETLFDRAHNMFIEVLVTMGLIGELAYIGLFVTIFLVLSIIKRKPELYMPAVILASMVVAYIIHNSFIFDTSANFIVLFSASGLISFLSRGENGLISQESSVIPQGLQWSVASILIIGALWLAYQTNVKTTLANYASTRGIIAGWNGDVAGMVTAYSQATADGSIQGRYEYRNQFAQSLLDYMATGAKLDQPATDAIKQAIALEEKNSSENPHDYLPELYLSRLNITLGQNDPTSPYNDEALKHSEKALTYSPTFVRTYYEVGQAYLNKKDYPDAIAAFQKAADLNPDVGLSYWYIGAVYMQEANTDKGLQFINEAVAHGYALSENDYLNLANVYIKRNDVTDLVGVYEGLVKIAPTNAQYRASLAAIYARVGRIDDAVAEAHAAAAADTTFTDAAKSFVQQLGRQW